MNILAPELATRRPDASNVWMGAKLEAEQSSAVAQRSNTQTLFPSRSMSTPTAAPHLRPSASFAHPSSTRYGLGAPFGSTVPWARIPLTSAAAIAATMPTPISHLILIACRISPPRVQSLPELDCVADHESLWR